VDQARQGQIGEAWLRNISGEWEDAEAAAINTQQTRVMLVLVCLCVDEG